MTLDRHGFGGRKLAVAVGFVALLVSIGTGSARAATFFGADDGVFIDGIQPSAICNSTPCENGGAGTPIWLVRFSKFTDSMAPDCQPSFPDPSWSAVYCPQEPLTIDLGDSEDTVWQGGDCGDMGTFSWGCNGVPVTINGGGGNDSLRTSYFEGTVSGEGGDDLLLDAGDGQVVYSGGAGHDVFQADAGCVCDAYVGQAGPVSITLDGQPNDGRIGDADNVGSDVEVIKGSDLDDSITGNSGPNELVGLEGDDALSGLGGDDQLSGGGCDGSQSPTECFLYVFVGGNDTLTGGPGNDTLDGVAGEDLLSGGSGDDALIGGLHTDFFGLVRANPGTPGYPTAPDGSSTAPDGSPGKDTIYASYVDEGLDPDFIDIADGLGVSSEDTVYCDVEDTILAADPVDIINGEAGGSCELPDCSDAINNDFDLLVDYPSDPGCSGPYDASELSSAQCDNGKDDDGDGHIDWPSDADCGSARDNSETSTRTLQVQLLTRDGESAAAAGQIESHPSGLKCDDFGLCIGEFAPNQSVEVRIHPAKAWRFLNWEDDTNCNGHPGVSCTVTLADDHVLTAMVAMVREPEQAKKAICWSTSLCDITPVLYRTVINDDDVQFAARQWMGIATKAYVACLAWTAGQAVGLAKASAAIKSAKQAVKFASEQAVEEAYGFALLEVVGGMTAPCEVGGLGDVSKPYPFNVVGRIPSPLSGNGILEQASRAGLYWKFILADLGGLDSFGTIQLDFIERSKSLPDVCHLVVRSFMQGHFVYRIGKDLDLYYPAHGGKFCRSLRAKPVIAPPVRPKAVGSRRRVRLSIKPTTPITRIELLARVGKVSRRKIASSSRRRLRVVARRKLRAKGFGILRVTLPRRGARLVRVRSVSATRLSRAVVIRIR